MPALPPLDSVREVFLGDLVPPKCPRGLDASTFVLGAIELPPGGVRETRGALTVRSQRYEAEDDLGGGLFDGLYDGERALLPVGPGEGERAAWGELAVQRRRQQETCPLCPLGYEATRLLRLGPTDDAYVSAWIGESEYTFGAAHSNNTLTCATWVRADGARVRLQDVLGQAEATRRLAALEAVVAHHRAESFPPPWEGDLPGPEGTGFLLSQGVPVLCLPVEMGPGGTTWIVPMPE